MKGSELARLSTFFVEAERVLDPQLEGLVSWGNIKDRRIYKDKYLVVQCIEQLNCSDIIVQFKHNGFMKTASISTKTYSIQQILGEENITALSYLP